MSTSSLSDTITLNDGRKIPQVALGTWQSPAGGETARAVQAALEAGYRHIDTAEVYKNEEDVGQGIRASGIPREEIWVTTKLFPRGKNYQQSLDSLEDSLKRLGLDYVDLYLIHAPIEPDLRKEQWQALEKLKEDGKARSIGISNYGAHHIDELLGYAKVPPAVNQIEISPYLQRTELVEKCRRHDIAIEAYSSLTRGKKLDDPKLKTIADRNGVTTAKVLLKWALQKGHIILPKSVHAERIKENADLFHFELSKEDIAELDALEEGLVTGWDPTTGP